MQSGWSGPYLSTSQFAATYGQTPKVINTIVNYLHLYGIHTSVYADRLDISATGTAAEFDNALSRRAEELPREAGQPDGRRPRHHAHVYGSKSDPQVPADVGSPVLAILGLTNYAPFASQAIGARHHHSSLKAAAGAGIPPGTDSRRRTSRTATTSTPLENQGAKGQGETIGIVTLARPSTADPVHVLEQVPRSGRADEPARPHPVDGGPAPVSSVNGSDETDLDVEQSGAIAPKANLRVYEAPNTDPGFADAFFAAASDNVADTVSVSWGESDTDHPAARSPQALEPAALRAGLRRGRSSSWARRASRTSPRPATSAPTSRGDAGTTNIAAAARRTARTPRRPAGRRCRACRPIT